ncbi:hypothetical protein F4811DRAFT_202040 [Daldinia bambusicola]|nr:hypothetical protein F4811DRAFT_202040 [Daldinia bambusicola]
MEIPSSAKSCEPSYQDVVSQFPLLNAYSNFLGIFELADNIPRKAVVSSVRAALDELKTLIPWLGYEVVNTGGPGGSGYIAAKPWPAGVVRHDFFVKQCDDLVASFADLAQAGFPVSMLPASILEPWPSLPIPATISPAPVSGMQLSFIQGGVIITICEHHTMVDGTGIHAFRRVLAVLLNGQGIPNHELVAANMNRARVIPLLAEGEPVKDHSHLLPRSPQDPEKGLPPPLPMPARWCVFRISRQAVEAICSLASDRDSRPGFPRSRRSQ